MSFHFRQFEVEDKQSTLRVGTDAMLLGAWANPGNPRKILDIGTGCGVLALMMAQKSDAMIDAIEIDPLSVNEARRNFASSPWPERIFAIHTSLQSFSNVATSDYDFILTNPPFFSDSLKSPSVRKNITRHNESLTHMELVRIISYLLSQDGSFALILPAETEDLFLRICQENRLNLLRRTMVFPKPNASPKRALLEFTRCRVTNVKVSELTILDAAGNFTNEYLALTNGFHNF